MNIGDTVEKVGGDYTFVGVVVSKFKKCVWAGGVPYTLNGPERFVVQDDRGVLHIYSEKNLRKI